MQYMFSLVRDDAAWDALTADERDESRAKIGAWVMEHAAQGRVQGGAELTGGDTATTVRFEGKSPIVMDGPFIEAREVLGGFVLMELEDLDQAIAIASMFPLDDHAVEIRPTVAR